MYIRYIESGVRFVFIYLFLGPGTSLWYGIERPIAGSPWCTYSPSVSHYANPWLRTKGLHLHLPNYERRGYET